MKRPFVTQDGIISLSLGGISIIQIAIEDQIITGNKAVEQALKQLIHP